MKSFVFPVVIEPDEEAWRAYVPDLEARGAATWGRTHDEALSNIREVAQLIIEDLLDSGEPLPASISISDQTQLPSACDD